MRIDKIGNKETLHSPRRRDRPLVPLGGRLVSRHRRVSFSATRLHLLPGRVHGYNSPTEPHVTHMHNTIWRLDVDLGNRMAWAGDNSARWVTQQGTRFPASASSRIPWWRAFNNASKAAWTGGPGFAAATRIVNEGGEEPAGQPDQLRHRARPHRSRPAFPNERKGSEQGRSGHALCRRIQGGDPRELSVIGCPDRRPGGGIENQDIVVW